MPRFVILRHTLPSGDRQGTHFDLMLEDEGKLLTWALPDLPLPGCEFIAMQLPDHRLAYLDYEGPISSNRGEVQRVEEGEFLWMERSEEVQSVELKGIASSVRIELRHIRGAEWRGNT